MPQLARGGYFWTRRSTFADGPVVSSYVVVAGQHGDAFDHGLGNEKAIKWAPVKGRVNPKQPGREGVRIGSSRSSLSGNASAKHPYDQPRNPVGEGHA